MSALHSAYIPSSVKSPLDFLYALHEAIGKGLHKSSSYSLHCVKSVRIASYSGPYFPAFRLNT